MPHVNEVTHATAQRNGQYSLAKILTIWALAAVPMPILAFIVAPAIASPGPVNLIITVWLLLIGGMVWQFVLSMIILRREGAKARWALGRYSASVFG